MKKFKFLAIVLLFAILFASCSASPEIAPEYKPNTNTSDFGGATFNWGFSMHRYAGEQENVFGYKPDTNFADTALERKKEVEDKFHCTINVDNNSNSLTIGDRLSVSLRSGAKLYDLATCDTSVLSGMVRSGGYLVGLSSLLDVSNTEKFGEPNMLQVMLWDDDLYGVVPFAWPELVSARLGLLITVNENLVARLGQTDPREYVENATWTWDQFEQTLADLTYQDTGRTIYAFNCHDAYFAMNMFLSNGVTFCEYEDDKVVFGAYTEPGRVALQRAQDIYTKTCKDFIYPDSSTTGHFLTEESVMGTSFLSDILNSVLYEMDNVGVIPFPQGPNATPGVYQSYYEEFTYATVIPSNANDYEASAKIIDAMYEPFEGYETKQDIIEYLAEQAFFDSRDAEVFMTAVRNTQYCFFWEGGRSGIESCVRGNDTVTSILEGMENVYDKLVEDYLISHYNGRIAVYGE